MAGSAEERRGRVPWRRAPLPVPARRHSGEVRADAPGSSAGNPRPKSMPAPRLHQKTDDGPGPEQGSDERARALARR
eukprot:1454815-Pyramimonas_sp.AAC.1